MRFIILSSLFLISFYSISQDVDNNKNPNHEFSLTLFELFVDSQLVNQDIDSYTIKSYHHYKDTLPKQGYEASKSLFGPSVTIVFKVLFREFDKVVISDSVKKLEFEWNLWNCDEIKKDSADYILPERKRNITVYLINGRKKARRCKNEKYLICDDSNTRFIMDIKCKKGIDVLREDLKSILFIERVFFMVNFYEKKYGCGDIVNI